MAPVAPCALVVCWNSAAFAATGPRRKVAANRSMSLEAFLVQWNSGTRVGLLPGLPCTAWWLSAR